jgi:hypothetical protein
VWFRLNVNGDAYDYLCTHVDVFMICVLDAKTIMDRIENVYTIKDIGPPNYYLGNDYKKDRQGRWCIRCQKYRKEAVKQVEGMFGSVKKYSSPSETGDHPEIDTSKVLDNEGHRKVQMLIRMLVWVITIGRISVAHATSSLSRFTACP